MLPVTGSEDTWSQSNTLARETESSLGLPAQSSLLRRLHKWAAPPGDGDLFTGRWAFCPNPLCTPLHQGPAAYTQWPTLVSQPQSYSGDRQKLWKATYAYIHRETYFPFVYGHFLASLGLLVVDTKISVCSSHLGKMALFSHLTYMCPLNYDLQYVIHHKLCVNSCYPMWYRE